MRPAASTAWTWKETKVCRLADKQRLSAVATVVLSFLCFGHALAQQPLGRMVGTVTDPAGAVIPGTTVTITETHTNVSRTVLTNDTGEYVAPYLADGVYNVKAEHAGFEVAIVSGVGLAAEQTVRIDFKMRLGVVTETTQVSAVAAQLQTDSVAVGSTLESQTVNDLPLNGRTFAQLAELVPGVQPVGSLNISTQRDRGSIGSPIAITANGFSSVQNNFIYDGEPAMDLDSYDFAFAPSIDAIQEFRVQTNTYSAAMGGAPGAQVDVITKSGTNGFHGGAWEFNRNSDLASRNYFSPTVATLNRNQFGSDLGGPIRKNKAFFFFNWESGRQIQGTASSLLNVPPTAFRTGDFSSLLPGTVIVDPTTGLPFPSNQIPMNRIDPDSTIYLGFTPQPNRASPTNNFLTNSFSTPTNENQYIGRVDYNVTSRDILSARYMFDTLETPNEPPVFGNDEVLNSAKGQNQVLSWTHTFSPAFVSNVLLGWNRFFETQVFGTTNDAKYNIACGLMTLPEVACDPFNYGPPDIEAGYNTFVVRDNGPRSRMNQRWSLDEKNSLQIRRHQVDFGGSVYRLNWTFHEVVFPRGIYGFDGFQTTPSGEVPTAANEFADFLLGEAHTITLSPTYFEEHENTWNTNFYIQDNWRIASNITVNMGLRYDLWDRAHKKEGSITNFLMDSYGGLIASGVMYPTSRPAGYPDTLVFNDYADWGPRLGIAWTPKSGTVVRAGYGRYYSPEVTNSFGNLGLNSPWLPFISTTFSDSSPIKYDNAGAVDALFSGAGALGAFGLLPRLRDGAANNWNVTVEHKLPSQILLNVGYVASTGAHLMTGWDANRAINYSLPGSPIVRPLPAYGAINMEGSIGTSDYNSLQVQLLRNIAKGLTVMGAYTFGKALGDVDGNSYGDTYVANGIQDIFHLKNSRSIQSFDVRHRLSTSMVYNLPFFEHGAGLDHKLLGGWSTNAIISEQTGIGNGVSWGGNTTNTGEGSLPDMIANPVLPRSARSVNEWFDTTAFVPAPVGRFGSSPRMSYHNPGINNVDFMVGKSFIVRESMSLALRAEFFDVFNHANFEDVNNTLLSPGFGTLTDALDPRIIQFALKLKF